MPLPTGSKSPALPTGLACNTVLPTVTSGALLKRKHSDDTIRLADSRYPTCSPTTSIGLPSDYLPLEHPRNLPWFEPAVVTQVDVHTCLFWLTFRGTIAIVANLRGRGSSSGTTRLHQGPFSPVARHCLGRELPPAEAEDLCRSLERPNFTDLLRSALLRLPRQ